MEKKFWKTPTFWTWLIPIVMGGGLVTGWEWISHQLEPDLYERLDRIETRLHRDSQYYKPKIKLALQIDSSEIMKIKKKLKMK